jgi:hypothetical protein
VKTLVAYLNEKTPQEMRNIADYWEASVTSKLTGGNTFELSRQLTSEYMQRRALEKLPPAQLFFLQKLLDRPQATALQSDLSTVIGLPTDETDSLASALRVTGFIYQDAVRVEAKEGAPAIPPPPTSGRGKGWRDLYRDPRQATSNLFQTRLVVLVPREMARTLSRLIREKLESSSEQATIPEVRFSSLPLYRLLASIEPETLDILAEMWGAFSLQGSSKNQQFYEELSGLMGDPISIARTLEETTSEARELFEHLKKAGRTNIPALLQTYVSRKRLDRALIPLEDLRLVWETFEDGQSVVWVPTEIAHPKPLPGAGISQALQTITEPADATLFPPYAFAWDLLSFLGYLKRNEVEVTNDGRVPKRHLKKILAGLWKPEDTDSPRRTAFLVALCSSIGLIDHELGDKTLYVSPQLNEWLKLDLYEQTRRLYRFWIEHPYYGEPVYFPYYYGSKEYHQQAVKVILGWLRECEPGVWYSVKSLLSKVEKENPFYIRSRRDLLNQFGASQVQYIVRQWPQVEGKIIRDMLDTALEWFGLVRVSRDAKGQPVAFSLTPFGAEISGKEKAETQVIPATDKPLLVLPNFEIMLYVPLSQTLWDLLLFAEPKKLDSISLFILSRTSVQVGLENGFNAESITGWLQARSTQPPAQNLIITIQDWCKGFKSVAVQRAVLLEVDSPAVLDELMNSKQYGSSFVRRLSPTAALVDVPEVSEYSRSDPLKSFKTKLRNSGYSVR